MAHHAYLISIFKGAHPGFSLKDETEPELVDIVCVIFSEGPKLILSTRQASADDIQVKN